MLELAGDFDAFELEFAVDLLLLALEHLQRFGIGLGKGGVDALLDAGVADQHEAPRLHVAYGRRKVGGRQDARQHFVRNDIRQELAADVTAGKDGLIDRIACGLGEMMVLLLSVVHGVPF